MESRKWRVTARTRTARRKAHNIRFYAGSNHPTYLSSLISRSEGELQATQTVGLSRLVMWKHQATITGSQSRLFTWQHHTAVTGSLSRLVMWQHRTTLTGSLSRLVMWQHRTILTGSLSRLVMWQQQTKLTVTLSRLVMWRMPSNPYICSHATKALPQKVHINVRTSKF